MILVHEQDEGASIDYDVELTLFQEAAEQWVEESRRFLE